MGAWQAGQAERGTTRLKRSAGGAVRRRIGLELGAFGAPRALHHDRQAMDDDVEEAADQQPQREAQPMNSAGLRRAVRESMFRCCRQKKRRPSFKTGAAFRGPGRHWVP